MHRVGLRVGLGQGCRVAGISTTGACITLKHQEIRCSACNTQLVAVLVGDCAHYLNSCTPAAASSSSSSLLPGRLSAGARLDSRVSTDTPDPGTVLCLASWPISL